MKGLFDVTDFAPPGTTDFAAAFAAAVQTAEAAGGGVVYIPPRSQPYLVSQTIDIRWPVEILGGGLATVVGRGATEIKGATGVSPVIRMLGGPGSGSTAARRLTVSSDGPPVPDGVGILISGCNYAVLEDIYLFKHTASLRVDNSLGTRLSRVTFSQATAFYLGLVNSPQNYVHACEFGRNGDLNGDPNVLVLLQGSTDTTHFSMCQFNPRTDVNQGIYFQDYNFGPDPASPGTLKPNVNGIITLHQCHMENVHYPIASNSATPSISRLFISNSCFHGPGSMVMVSLDAATAALEWMMSGNNIIGNEFSITRGDCIRIIGNNIPGGVQVGPNVTNKIIQWN